MGSVVGQVSPLAVPARPVARICVSLNLENCDCSPAVGFQMLTCFHSGYVFFFFFSENKVKFPRVCQSWQSERWVLPSPMEKKCVLGPSVPARCAIMQCALFSVGVEVRYRLSDEVWASLPSCHTYTHTHTHTHAHIHTRNPLLV